MSELEKDKTKYSRLAYWNERYQEEEEYDWLGTYDAVKSLISEFVSERKNKILMLGCGNSTLSKKVNDPPSLTVKMQLI